jgi:hypothetical protein
MKSLLTLAAFGILFGSNAHAVQHFTCWNLPLDAYSNDRVVISLSSATEGTLFLSSGLDDNGDQDSTGPLKMERVTARDGQSSWVAHNTTSTFTVVIPDSVVGHNADDVVLELDLSNDSESSYHQALQIGCYTRMYD